MHITLNENKYPNIKLIWESNIKFFYFAFRIWRTAYRVLWVIPGGFSCVSKPAVTDEEKKYDHFMRRVK